VSAAVYAWIPMQWLSRADEWLLTMNVGQNYVWNMFTFS
jgi:hypothetical protein